MALAGLTDPASRLLAVTSTPIQCPRLGLSLILIGSFVLQRAPTAFAGHMAELKRLADIAEG